MEIIFYHFLFFILLLFILILPVNYLLSYLLLHILRNDLFLIIQLVVTIDKVFTAAQRIWRILRFAKINKFIPFLEILFTESLLLILFNLFWYNVLCFFIIKNILLFFYLFEIMIEMLKVLFLNMRMKNRMIILIDFNSRPSWSCPCTCTLSIIHFIFVLLFSMLLFVDLCLIWNFLGLQIIFRLFIFCFL